MHELIKHINRRILDKQLPLVSDTEALTLMHLPKSEQAALIYLGGLAKEAFGAAQRTFRCAIVNAKSGRCTENCAFCAQSNHYKTSAPIFPMLSSDELLQKARRVNDYRVDRFGIVTSGKGPSNNDITTLSDAAKKIREQTDVQLCASLGLLTPQRAQALREAGFTSYHHNLECARSFFPSICTTHDYEDDVNTVRIAKQAGFRVCSCGIFGLGESWEQRIELARTLQELDVDSLPVNFLIPIAGTPLEHHTHLSPNEALRIILLLRLMLPTKDIVICGGRLQALQNVHSWCFAAGANAIMTGDYLTRSGNALEDDLQMMNNLGL